MLFLQARTSLWQGRYDYIRKLCACDCGHGSLRKEEQQEAGGQNKQNNAKPRNNKPELKSGMKRIKAGGAGRSDPRGITIFDRKREMKTQKEQEWGQDKELEWEQEWEAWEEVGEEGAFKQKKQNVFWNETLEKDREEKLAQGWEVSRWGSLDIWASSLADEEAFFRAPSDEKQEMKVNTKSEMAQSDDGANDSAMVYIQKSLQKVKIDLFRSFSGDEDESGFSADGEESDLRSNTKNKVSLRNTTEKEILAKPSKVQELTKTKPDTIKHLVELVETLKAQHFDLQEDLKEKVSECSQIKEDSDRKDFHADWKMYDLEIKLARAEHENCVLKEKLVIFEAGNSVMNEVTEVEEVKLAMMKKDEHEVNKMEMLEQENCALKEAVKSMQDLLTAAMKILGTSLEHNEKEQKQQEQSLCILKQELDQGLKEQESSRRTVQELWQVARELEQGPGRRQIGEEEGKIRKLEEVGREPGCLQQVQEMGTMKVKDENLKVVL